MNRFQPDDPWIRFRNTLIGLVAGGIALVLLLNFANG